MKRLSGLAGAAVGFVLLALTVAPGPAQAAAEQELETLLQMADYIGVDYPEFVVDGRVLNEEEYQEQVEFAGNILAQVRALPESPVRTALLDQAEALDAAIAAKAPGDRVQALTGEISRLVMANFPIATAPREAPDLAGGEQLFRQNCVSCHGESGRGDGPAAAGMEPPPTDFSDRVRASQRSVYGLYNTISLGVEGTAMPGFAQLSDAQRWALAFYVSRLHYAPADLAQGEALWRQAAAAAPFASLADVTRATPAQVAAQHGEQAAAVLAYLRANPRELAVADQDALGFTRKALADSLQAYRAGDFRQAQQLALTAYLEGFELAEASLGVVDRGLVLRIEAQLMDYRQALAQRVPAEQLAAQLEAIDRSLAAAAERLGGAGLSTVASFLGSFVILAREGLEAILVLAAIFALLNRAGQPQARRYVHVGWIGALLLGVATWFVSTYLVAISGASREITEGVSALLAAAILLYVGYWMHGKSYAAAWQRFVADKVQGALSKRNLWLLTLLAFLAVYREAFETVLFYRAIWTQGDHGAIVAGMAAAAAALVAVSWAIFRFSARLPIAKFFSWSSLLIAALAVMFVGNGVAALQEAGLLPVDPVPFVSLPLLGIYENAQALLAQAAIVALFVLAFGLNHRRAKQLEAGA